MAYEIINRLEQMGKIEILAELSSGVEAKRKANKIYMKCASCPSAGRKVTVIYF